MPCAICIQREYRTAHERAGDRGGAGAAVGLQHVAIDPHRALADAIEIDHHGSAAPDQALDLRRAAIDCLPAASRALRVLVEPGNMPYSAVSQPPPDPCGAPAALQHAGRK